MSWQRYASYADAAYAALMGMSYDSSAGMWDDIQWWHAANALTAAIDYAAARPVAYIQTMMATVFEKNSSTNFKWAPGSDWYKGLHVHHWAQEFDDEGWWALAWLAAYDLVTRPGTRDTLGMAPKYLAMAQTIFDDMSSQWTWKCGGGLFWSTDFNYKNAITNELFLTLALRLHQRTGDGRYLDWALSEWNWFQKSGMRNRQGLINDGLDFDTCSNNGHPTFTYNQGVILGGLADLFLVTADPTYIATAWSIFEAVCDPINALIQDGVLVEPVKPDAGSDCLMFKGIFARNVAYLFAVDPDADPDPTKKHRPAYMSFFAQNANSLWMCNRSSGNAFGYAWQGPFDSGDAARQASALEAFVAGIALDSI